LASSLSACKASFEEAQIAKQLSQYEQSMTHTQSMRIKQAAADIGKTEWSGKPSWHKRIVKTPVKLVKR